MAKAKRKLVNFQAPATKADVEELALLTDKNFRRIDERTERMEQNMATKEDLKQFATKEDLKSSEKRILDGVKTLMEIRDEELQEKHEIELARVEGKQETPSPWKSIPRRLKTVEMDVEIIKDHLEI